MPATLTPMSIPLPVQITAIDYTWQFVSLGVFVALCAVFLIVAYFGTRKIGVAKE